MRIGGNDFSEAKVPERQSHIQDLHIYRTSYLGFFFPDTLDMLCRTSDISSSDIVMEKQVHNCF